MENQGKEAEKVESGAGIITVGRIVSFSDAVFAVAITILVLNIDAPDIQGRLGGAELSRELINMWPVFTAFAISFLIIGLFWVLHHSMFKYIKRHDAGLIWLNLVFLMCIVFLPFPVSLISRFDSRVAVIFYAISLGVTELVMCLLWLYAAGKGRLVDKELEPATFKHIWLTAISISLVFFVSAVIAVWSTSVAQYFWLACFPIAFLLGRRYPWKEKPSIV